MLNQYNYRMYSACLLSFFYLSHRLHATLLSARSVLYYFWRIWFDWCYFLRDELNTLRREIRKLATCSSAQQVENLAQTFGILPDSNIKVSVALVEFQKLLGSEKKSAAEEMICAAIKKLNLDEAMYDHLNQQKRHLVCRNTPLSDSEKADKINVDRALDAMDRFFDPLCCGCFNNIENLFNAKRNNESRWWLRKTVRACGSYYLVKLLFWANVLIQFHRLLIWVNALWCSNSHESCGRVFGNWNLFSAAWNSVECICVSMQYTVSNTSLMCSLTKSWLVNIQILWMNPNSSPIIMIIKTVGTAVVSKWIGDDFGFDSIGFVQRCLTPFLTKYTNDRLSPRPVSMKNIWSWPL